MKKIISVYWLVFLCTGTVHGFSAQYTTPRLQTIGLLSQSSNEEQEPAHFSRREACRLTIGGAIASSAFAVADKANAEDGYKPAPRPTAYRVDSTQPPTLIPLSSARKESAVLAELGKGYGTGKTVILDDSVNLNNILNKAVFGSIDAVYRITGIKKDETKSGTGYSSFVCMGVPTATTSTDVELVVDLLGPIVKESNADTAIGLSFCPLSAQADLDDYSKSGEESGFVDALKKRGISEEMVALYLPIMRYARRSSLKLLALSPEQEDILTARSKGLQSVDPDRRQSYVVDAEGFIAMSADPRFRMYTERSLLKDFTPLNSDDKPGNFFSERILVHETAATVAAAYAVQRPDSLVVVVAPTPDLRFLLGINGRIPRLCRFLDPSNSKVTADSVTTVLVNPTAKETLSKSRFLRLEIGTGPENLDFQAKLSDYLWFSSSPKVNLIPRMMNG
jgi:hypothetical protein